MSKVLVDRELLERLQERLDPHRDAAAWGALCDALRRAQPTEAEGAVAQLRRVIDELKAGFVVCQQCGDQEDTATLDCVPELEAIAAALSAVTAERDRLQRNLDFTDQWYAARFERLADLGKSVGCWDAMAAIIANGTADHYEPPTYAQQLASAKHRADESERERDQLRAEVEALRAFGNEMVSAAFWGGSFDGGDIQDIAVKHGLLRVEQREAECGDACACSEYGFPSECYRKTELLGVAALAAKEG